MGELTEGEQMDPLDRIRDALDKGTGNGRDYPLARAIACEYVEDNPEAFLDMEDWTREQCVEAVSTFRTAGDTHMQWSVEAWLLHRFDPVVITGTLNYQAAG
jgi:hypothetical protein